MITFGELIAGNWWVMLVFLLFSSIFAADRALRSKRSEVFWRGIKLASTGAGALGIIVFISNVELAIKSQTSDKSAQDRLLEFIETKSVILAQMAISCNNQPSELCGLAGSANGVINPIGMRNNSEFTTVGPVPRDAGGRRFYDKLERQVEILNEAVLFSNNVGEFLSKDNRLFILLIGQIVIILAFAGSIGEATFQFRESRKKQQSASN